MSGKVVTYFLSVDFLRNYEKGVWRPQKSLEWLDFAWNLESGQRYFISARFKNAQYFEIFTIGTFS